METYKLVMPEHLNHYGYLFGGNLLKWVDEVAWIGASLDFPGCRLVTVALDRVEFKKSIKEGSILRFKVLRSRLGITSVQYGVEVTRGDLAVGGEEPVFSTRITFVRVDDHDAKAPLPPPVAPGEGG